MTLPINSMGGSNQAAKIVCTLPEFAENSTPFDA